MPFLCCLHTWLHHMQVTCMYLPRQEYQHMCVRFSSLDCKHSPPQVSKPLLSVVSTLCLGTNGMSR